MSDIEALIRYRLRMQELVPVEMSRYRIGLCFCSPFRTGNVIYAKLVMLTMALQRTAGYSSPFRSYSSVPCLYREARRMTGGSSCTSSFSSMSGVITPACRVYHIFSGFFAYFSSYNLRTEFPRIPSGILKQHLTNEADSQLGHYLPFSQDLQLPPGVELPPRPQLPEGVIDSPLIRVYNFLRELFAYSLDSARVTKRN